MTFFFDQKKGDLLMQKINLRDINARAKQWDHPVKGLFKYAKAMKTHGGNILKIPKEDRERYCISLVALELKNDSDLNWWTNIPPEDPPDGLIMTVKEEQKGVYMGYLREFEVVEHREESSTLLNVIQNKMTGKSYEQNTILVCLALTPGVYNFKSIAEKLENIDSPTKHVFVVFSGISLTDEMPLVQNLKTTYTLIQLLPIFQQTVIDLTPHLEDFKQRYDLGQEARLIGNNQIHYGTTNPKFQK